MPEGTPSHLPQPPAAAARKGLGVKGERVGSDWRLERPPAGEGGVLAGSISYWLLPGAPGRATWCVRRGEQSIRSSDKKNKQARALISRRQQEGRRDEQARPPLLAAARCTRDCVSRTPQPGRAGLTTSGRHRDSEEGREAKGGGRKSKQGGRVLYREGRKGSGDRCTQQPHTGEKALPHYCTAAGSLAVCRLGTIAGLARGRARCRRRRHRRRMLLHIKVQARRQRAAAKRTD
jgi:hypothetical protein